MGGRGSKAPKAATNGNTPPGSISNDEQDALEWYVSGEGMFINNALRGLNPDIRETDLTDSEKDALSKLDALTGRDKVGEGTLYRTVDASAIFGGITDTEYEALRSVAVYGDNQKFYKDQADKALKKMKSSFTDAGFMSTTKMPQIAEDISYDFGSDKPIILEIKTSKKTKGIDVNKYANARMKEVEQSDPQKEVLLARKQTFAIDKKISKTKNGFIKVTLYAD